MPLTSLQLDDRRYEELRDEALSRIPIHNPEWTNFNESDPGVTLVELFAFLTENLLYRVNQIPRRNQLKFLSMLGIPLNPAKSAQGIVAFAKANGGPDAITLTTGSEVMSGQISFRLTTGLDVLPIEADVYYKKRLTSTGDVAAYYKQLYASFLGQSASVEPQLYEAIPLSSASASGVDVSGDSVDSSLWIALLRRSIDAPAAGQTNAGALTAIRDAIEKKTLSIGIVPILTSSEEVMRHLMPGRAEEEQATASVSLSIATNELGLNRQPQYRLLKSFGVPALPATVEVDLPDASQLNLWEDLDPLEAGADRFPPSLDDTEKSNRLITWLRMEWPKSVKARIKWVGVNAAMISQRTKVVNEQLPSGSGKPDQKLTLANASVVQGSLSLSVTPPGASQAEAWVEIDDLLGAGPEVPVPNELLPPNSVQVSHANSKVFAVDYEAGEVRFGDGMHGARPPYGALMRVSYEYGVGRKGNVSAGSINSCPALPAGFTVKNPVGTWGGSDAESAEDGENHVAEFLRHRDRLVSAEDFKSIARRTPGADIGRVDVLPAYNPALSGNLAGMAAGAVTLMVIPKYDSTQPDAPSPDQPFLDAICSYLNPRRLVTTEIFLRGPTYKKIWVSVGISAKAGASSAEVREAVAQALKEALSPLPVPDNLLSSEGWPLGKAVVDLELVGVVNRVPGVVSVKSLVVAQDDSPASSRIEMEGLELPRLMKPSVTIGDAADIEQLRGKAEVVPTQGPTFVAVPMIPQECR
jgi:hypothetical protein